MHLMPGSKASDLLSDATILHLLIPGLLDRVFQWTKDYGEVPRFSAIEAIMAKSQQRIFHAHGADATLCALFGLAAEQDHDLPFGAVRRYGYGGARDTGYWLCADPVHLSAGIAQVFLREGDTLDIRPSEANQLASLFSAHYAEKDWVLEVASPRHWHLRIPTPPQISTFPQRRIMGQPIEAYLPAGSQATLWRALLNEIQMLFHDAEINRDREQSGEIPINALWLSGAGTLPAAGSVHTNAAVWTDDPLAIGLSRLANVENWPAPASLDVILRSRVCESHLVFLDTLLAPVSFDDLPAWGEALRGFETAWFWPIDRALKTGRLAQCHIYDCAGQKFSLGRVRRWSSWRRRKPLHAYNQMPEDNPSSRRTP